MKLVLKPLQFLYNIYAIVVFVILMIIIFPFVLMAALFGKITGGNMIYRICMLWADIWFFLVGIFHRNYFEQPINKNEQYIYVANHISYLDAPIIVKAIRTPIRALGKVEMKNVPLFGFIYKYAVVLVDRRDPENRAKSVRNMKSIINKGISIFVFPEGTFNMTHEPLKEFYDGAFRVAIETQTPIKPILFLDAYDRMNYKKLLSISPGKSRAIYLDKIAVDGLKQEDIPVLKKKVYKIMDEKLREYHASWIK